MAKDNEDDDKFEKMDEESLSFLEQVRKGKSRNFVLSMKGNKVRSMIVKKKPVKEKDRKAAKGEGYQPVYGVVTGKGAQINFMVARSDGFDEKAADRKTEKLKKFLSQQTGKVFKPTFELVDNPPPVPFDDEDLNDPLIAKFMKMEPVINKACEAHPDSIPLIQTTVNMIRGLLQDEETRQQAAPKIDEFVQYLKDLLAGNSAIPPAPPMPDSAAPPSPEASPAPSVDPAEQVKKLAEALKKLKPLVDKAVNADPNRQGELHATMTQIAGEIKNKELDKAKSNITDFATLLKSLIAQQPTGPVDRTLEFASRRDGMESSFLEAKRAAPDKATKLAGVWDYANDQAQAGNYENAFKALDRLATAISGLVSQQGGTPTDLTTEVDPQEQQLSDRMEALESRLLEAQKANPEAATKLGAAWSMASEKLQAKDLASVVKILDRLEPAIQNALESAPKTDTERFGIREGFVAERRTELEQFFVTRVSLAKSESESQMKSVAKAISDRVPDEDAEELATAAQEEINDFYSQFQEALIASMDSEDVDVIRSTVNSWRGQVESHPLLQHLEKSKSALDVDASVLTRFENLFSEVNGKLQEVMSA